VTTSKWYSPTFAHSQTLNLLGSPPLDTSQVRQNVQRLHQHRSSNSTQWLRRTVCQKCLSRGRLQRQGRGPFRTDATESTQILEIQISLVVDRVGKGRQNRVWKSQRVFKKQVRARAATGISGLMKTFWFYRKGLPGTILQRQGARTRTSCG